MRNSTDLTRSHAPEAPAHRDTGPRADISRLIQWRGLAGNDADCGDSPTPGDDTAAWARHAQAANGFGAAATGDQPEFVRQTAYEAFRAARARRAILLGGIFAAAIRAVTEFVRQAHARYKQRHVAWSTYHALRELDDHTLRDLGFDRSELTSIAAEASASAEYTRVRALPHSYPTA